MARYTELQYEIAAETGQSVARVAAAQRRMAPYHAKAAAENEAFWASLKVGQIIHYDNGREEYVRGEVVEVNGEKQIKPFALLGNWRADDLKPTAYHAKRAIANADSWRCHSTCLWERKRTGTDPRTLPVLVGTEAPLNPVKRPAPSEADYAKGARVMAVWPDDGLEYPATITKRLRRGFTVCWDACGTESNVTAVRPLRPSRKTA